MIPILSKIFHKYHAIHWDIVSGRRDLLIDLPFTKRTKLQGQILYFLYKKNEPTFYQEICRVYLDDYSDQEGIRENYFARRMGRNCNTFSFFFKPSTQDFIKQQFEKRNNEFKREIK